MGVSSSVPLPVKTQWFPEFEQNLPSLEGKTVCITGCTTGTGFVVARTAIRKGASNVLLLNRQSDRAEKAEQLLKGEVVATSSSSSNIETIPCDLQDFESVKEAASTIKSKYESVDVLCNNAGVMALEDKATKDGYDVQMQTNHLSHFLLTKELLPLLKKAIQKNGEARICNHSSEARHGSALMGEYLEKNGGNLGGNGSGIILRGARWIRYQQTKLANSVFSLSLAERIEKTNYQHVLKSVCAQPGQIATTNPQKTTTQMGGIGKRMWIIGMSQSQEDGSMPIIAACFDPSTQNGSFWAPSTSWGGIKGPPIKVAYDYKTMNEDSKTLLWEKSELACGKFEF
mmetsp:Transcript_22153/g.27967  ORF Transcript_22153/g.27967 Transcript_22153/m.27967 type:complete len:343 (+) Transcript_22153:68-1096(+)